MSGENRTKEKKHLGMKAKSRISNTIIYIVLIIMSAIWLIPFVCIVLQSFRTESTYQVGYVIPEKWGWDNYLNLITTKGEDISDKVTLKMVAADKVKPVEEKPTIAIAPEEGTIVARVTRQPSNITGADGDTVEFSVKGRGFNLEYQWQYYDKAAAAAEPGNKDAGWVDCTFEGAKKSKLLVPVSQETDGMQFRCRLSGIKYFDSNFVTWYKNTLIMALVCAVISTMFVLCMSYTLSRFRFKLRKPLMKFMLILGMFPGMLSMIILYRVLKDMGMTMENAVPGLIFVYVASSGMGYYISKGFFDTIPKSLDEAARVDGATRLQVFISIIMPMAKPIVIYTVLTAFMGPWADFVFAKYISFNTSAGMNVAVGLYSWLNKDMISSRYTMFCAGGVIVAIPVTILFMCLQKYYVEGVTGGSVKG